jgi:hypothetical protein
MLQLLHFCQAYSGAIQAIATVVLIGITSYYAVVTHESLKVASRQLETSLLPQVSIEFGQRYSSAACAGTDFFSEARIYNGGVHPFTVAKAEVRLYGDADSPKPLAVKELPGLTDRLVAGGTQTAEGIQIPSTEVIGDSKQVAAAGKWKLEISLHVYNALHTQVYKFLYDKEHGIRRLSQ